MTPALSNIASKQSICVDRKGPPPSVRQETAILNANAQAPEAKLSAVAKLKANYPNAVQVMTYQEADNSRCTDRVWREDETHEQD